MCPLDRHASAELEFRSGTAGRRLQPIPAFAHPARTLHAIQRPPRRPADDGSPKPSPAPAGALEDALQW